LDCARIIKPFDHLLHLEVTRPPPSLISHETLRFLRFLDFCSWEEKLVEVVLVSFSSIDVSMIVISTLERNMSWFPWLILFLQIFE
jgi:hypothetical protein